MRNRGQARRNTPRPGGASAKNARPDRLSLAEGGLKADQIDRIFLTAGSSLVPAVRAIFHRRFDSDRIESGSDLESIASGLALMGRERDLDRWCRRAEL